MEQPRKPFEVEVNEMPPEALDRTAADPGLLIVHVLDNGTVEGWRCGAIPGVTVEAFRHELMQSMHILIRFDPER